MKKNFSAPAIGTGSFVLFAFCLMASLVVPTWAQTPATTSQTQDVAGTVEGLNGAIATLTLGNDGYLRTTQTDARGHYEFKGIPYGNYFLKAEASGFALGKAKTGTLPLPQSVAIDVRFQAVAIPNNRFTFHWEDDGSRGGYEVSANIVKPPVITFLNEQITPADPAAANALLTDYNIILSNERVAWTQEFASRLQDMMRIIPQAIQTPYTSAIKPSKWVLTDDFIADDIRISRSEKGDTVMLSTAAMVNAAPRMVLIDGVKGNFFSKRLHHALVRFVTQDGSNIPAVEKILRERFGTSILVPDYTALTAATTQEDQSRFTQFRPSELVEIINMFEEMPKGLHVVKGLNYLVRRNFGQKNPKFFCDAAIAYPRATPDGGYIEFVDGAFSNLAFTHHVVIHEKSHFLWEYLFDSRLRDAWAKVGGWYPDPTDRDGWSTTQTTTFVSAYAHKKNPNEDMAESIAAFVLDPSLLKSRAPAKFEFIRDNVMFGGSFVNTVRNDLQFDVLNLFPDYDYPGKIKRIDVTVDGGPEDDKVVTLELELNRIPGKFDGANAAYFILQSPAKTNREVWLFPKRTTQNIEPGTSNVLTTSFTVSKYAKAGFWAMDQIMVRDAVGNARYEGAHDFGWKLYVNNALEDIEAPRYVPHSLKMQVAPAAAVEGHAMQKLVVTWQVDNNGAIDELNNMAAWLIEKNSKAQMGSYGYYDSTTKTARVEFDITEFHASGQYEVTSILLKDSAGNRSTQDFSDSPKDETPVSIAINTSNPDYVAPELDINNIKVTATPTNPSAPNGETQIQIVFYAKDNKSGLRNAYYSLLDPQGILHTYWYWPPNDGKRFFSGDPAAWSRYEMNALLPTGSIPGRWGLAEIDLIDRVYNEKAFNFREVLHFEIK